MKRKSDPRHLKRVHQIQQLFAWNFQNQPTSDQTIKPLIKNLKKIDQLIAKSAPERPTREINKIDLAILRLAVFELIIEKGVPPKVVIDEAVELGKEYGSESSPAFINGVLGKLVELKKVEIS